ncbi:MAG: MGH1-like glycoside hydrolase domain-containing protein [Beutenbergiaceae bacterium]
MTAAALKRWSTTAWTVPINPALPPQSARAIAEQLSQKLVKLALEHEFAEYVDPHTGVPHGSRRFSWTAALTVDLLAAR